MTCAIHEHGYWVGSEGLPHVHDADLASGMAEFLDGMSVVDLGCGDGFYVGKIPATEIAGFDGNPDTPTVTGGQCGVADLTDPAMDVGQWDAVLFLEVGEHIPPEHEATVIANVAKTSRRLIVVSWAQPGQGGHGHVNCLFTDDVRERFKAYGFVCDEVTTLRLRHRATVSWFQTNLLVLTKETTQ